MLCVILLAAVSDIRTGKIRNRLILLGYVSGFIISVYGGGIKIIPLWFLKIIIPVILFYLLFRIGALGAGDIKLFSVIAGFLTIKDFWICMVAAFLSGAVFCAGKIMFSKKMKHPHTIHFSIPILAGYLYYLGVMC